MAQEIFNQDPKIRRLILGLQFMERGSGACWKCDAWTDWNVSGHADGQGFDLHCSQCKAATATFYDNPDAY